MRDRREAKHKELVELAKGAITQWERAPREVVSWDDWVASEVTRMAWSRGLLNPDPQKNDVVTGRMIRGWAKPKARKKMQLKPPAERKRGKDAKA